MVENVNKSLKVVIISTREGYFYDNRKRVPQSNSASSPVTKERFPELICSTEGMEAVRGKSPYVRVISWESQAGTVPCGI